MIADSNEFDSALGFLRDGYLFGSRRFRKVGGNAFTARLLGIPVVVMRGSDAARFFYEQGRFTRTAALPPSITHLLQDAKSVQTLEGEEHRHRKSLFTNALIGPQTMLELNAAVERHWMAAARDWPQRRRVSLAEEVPRILARAVIEWTGIDAGESDMDRRAGELLAMVDNAGRIGPLNWAARARRLATERWARTHIERARTSPDSFEGTALAAVAAATDTEGRPLPTGVAAVELINILRPFVAIQRFILFAALGLRRRPDLADAFARGDESMLENFAQEVRRFFPFFPVIAGRAARDLEWNGHTFARGSLAMLDLYGTDHDPELWTDPEMFRPERFVGMELDPNHLIAQGGGTFLDDHRCPGEPATVSVIMQSVRMLTRAMHYEVPPQDLRISLRTFPAIPRSGVVLSNVSLRNTLSEPL